MGTHGDPGDGIEQAARASNARFTAAIRGGDPVAAAAAYATDARLQAPSSDLIEGRTGIASFWRAGLDAGIRDMDRVPARIDQHGSVAYETGHYTIRLRPRGGGSVVDRGTYLVVHQREADGAWRWAAEAFTPEGAPRVDAAAPWAEAKGVAERD